MSDRVLRRTLLGHVLVTAAACALVCVLVATGVWWLAHDEAQRRAEQVSKRVATAVMVSLTTVDLSDAGPDARARLVEGMAPFRQTGMVERAKVWRVDGPSAQVVFSDDPRFEGLVRRGDPGPAPGATVVLDTPDAGAPRAADGRLLRDVHVGFTDAAGRPARLSVHVPVDIEGATARAVGVLVPPAVAGLLAVALAVLPLSVALARRRERERAERRDAAHYGLTAGELARRDLARRLHDDVLPGLASAGLMLDLAPARPELVPQARRSVGDGVVRIRSVLDDLVPDDLEVDDDGVTTALVRLADEGSPTATVTVLPGAADALDTRTAVLLVRIASELLRNARAHAGASQLTVDLATAGDRARLTVADDGVGFDPTRGPEPGHIGLLLVRRAAEDAGGRVRLRSAPGAGTAVTVTVRCAAVR